MAHGTGTTSTPTIAGQNVAGEKEIVRTRGGDEHRSLAVSDVDVVNELRGLRQDLQDLSQLLIRFLSQ